MFNSTFGYASDDCGKTAGDDGGYIDIEDTRQNGEKLFIIVLIQGTFY